MRKPKQGEMLSDMFPMPENNAERTAGEIRVEEMMAAEREHWRHVLSDMGREAMEILRRRRGKLSEFGGE